jgi:2-polyprenyl-6-methoxyphenol hydroxylase-like FAD-dependent oxidoreductase
VETRRRALAPRAEELLAGLTSFEETRFATYLHVQMMKWHTGRFLLLGDAAHAMSPHLGQGINLALLDGLTIAHVLATAPDPAAAFKLYAQARRMHTNFYALVTFALSPFFQSRGVIRGWGRDVVLPMLPHLPVVGGQMRLTMTGLKRSALGGGIRLP